MSSFSGAGSSAPGIQGSTIVTSLQSITEHTVDTGTATASGASTPIAIIGILVQALFSNSISVWIGGPTVTINNGIELEPGSSITLAVNSASQIYSIATSSGQKLRILVI